MPRTAAQPQAQQPQPQPQSPMTAETMLANINANLLPLDAPQIEALDKVATAANLVSADAGSPFKQMLRTANGVMQLQALLTPEMMTPIMSLQGTSLGFRTDKDNNGGYPVEIVRNCLIEAVIRGVSPVGSPYITKEGFGHLLANIAGLRYMITPNVPKISNGTAEAGVNVRWTYNGKEQEKDLVFAVRVNAGMGADAINGKATRKARAWLYMQVTGMEVGEGDVTDTTATPRQVVSPLEKNVVDIEATEVKEEPAEEMPRLRKAFAERGVDFDAVKGWFAQMNWAFDNEDYLLQNVESIVHSYKESVR